jgi:hypothetical protein
MFANHQKCSLFAVWTNISFPYTKCIIIVIIIITVVIIVVVVGVGCGGGGGGGNVWNLVRSFYFFFL